MKAMFNVIAVLGVLAMVGAMVHSVGAMAASNHDAITAFSKAEMAKAAAKAAKVAAQQCDTRSCSVR